MENFSAFVMTVAMIGAFLLIVGGVRLSVARQTRARGILMILAALVMVMNVMIWTV